MQQLMSPWQVLNITATQDERSIKRAYAIQLKLTRPDDDHEKFQILRQAYEFALLHAAQAAREEPIIDEVLTANADLSDESNSTGASHALAKRDMSVSSDAFADSGKTQQQAQQLLADLLVSNPAEASTHMKELLEGKALLSLVLREEFEWRAFCYCGQPNAIPIMEDVFFVAFGWENDLRHIARRNPSMVQHVLRQRYVVNVVHYATRLWGGMLAQGISQAENAFLDLRKRGALNHPAVNLEFQKLACRYCSGADINYDLAATLIKEFEWTYDLSHLDHEHQALARQALARQVRFKENRRDWMQLQHDAQTVPELKLLLGNRLPGSGWSLQDKRMVRTLQHWVNVIREKYPDILQNNLNRPVFEAWAKKVDGKRYFLQTFLYSLCWGIPFAIFLACLFEFPANNPLFPSRPAWELMLLGEAGAVLIIAWYALLPPEKLINWTLRQKQKLHDRFPWSSREQANYTAIGLLALYALCLPTPAPNTLPAAWIGPLLFLNLCLLVCLVSRDLGLVKIGMALLAGLLICLRAPDAALAAGFFVALLLMIFRGANTFVRLYGPDRLRSARVIWLTFALLLFAARPFIVTSGQFALLLQSVTLLAFSCVCLAGIQLAEFYLHGSTVPWLIATLFLAYLLTSAGEPPRMLPELTLLVTASNYLMICIFINLIQEKVQPGLKKSSTFT